MNPVKSILEYEPKLFGEEDRTESEYSYPGFGKSFLDILEKERKAEQARAYKENDLIGAKDYQKLLETENNKYKFADYYTYKQGLSDSIYNRYVEGEKWLMSEGEDDLAKGFINNFRSAIGSGVEDFAYLINDIAPWYTPAGKVVENNTAGEIAEQAQKQFGNARASGVNGKFVDAMDMASKGLGYNIFGLKAGDYMQTLGEGFEEYRRLREQGYTKEEATKKSLAKTGFSFVEDKLWDKGGDFLINRIPQRGVYGVRADFETNISPKTLRKTTVEDFFGENKEITDIEYEEILQFKNCEYKINIQNGVSCFPKTDGIYKNVQKVKPVKYGKTNEYCFDIGMHGNPQNVAFANTNDAPIMTPKALAVAISQNTNYKKGQPVRLLSCNTGKELPFDDCFAQKLANEINAPVLAPTDTLYISKKGNLTIGIDGSGEMAEFIPIYSLENNFNYDWRTLNGGRKR